MKKVIPVVLALVMCITVLVGCGGKGTYLDKASKNLDNYEIVMSYDEANHKVSATQTVTLTNRTDNAFNSVKFHIYANAYRENAGMALIPSGYVSEAYPNGKSYGDITFDSVKVKNEAVAFVIEGEDSDILSVPVSSFYPNEKNCYNYGLRNNSCKYYAPFRL